MKAIEINGNRIKIFVSSLGTYSFDTEKNPFIKAIRVSDELIVFENNLRLIESLSATISLYLKGRWNHYQAKIIPNQDQKNGQFKLKVLNRYADFKKDLLLIDKI